MINISEFRHILIIEDVFSKRVLVLENETYSLGRDPSNDLILHDRQVSRSHATLIKQKIPNNPEVSYKIIDGDLRGTKSTNGILVNESSCTEKLLKHGDMIRFSIKSKASYYIISNISMIDFLTDSEELVPLEEVSVESAKITLPSSAYLNPDLVDSRRELIRLASFPELSPNPIIEMNWQGEITYLNSAANLKFKQIHQLGLSHPILAGIITDKFKEHGSLLVREVQVSQEYFDEYIHYLAHRNLIRIYIFDLTERKKIELSLRESEEKYKAVVRQVYEGICLIDSDTYQVLEANEAYCQLLGYSAEEAAKLTLMDMIDHPEDFLPSLNQLMTENKDCIGELNYLCKNGSLLKAEVSVSLIKFTSQQAFCFVVRDITKRKQQEDLLKYRANHDDLTGLTNRYFFEQQLITALDEAEENGNHLAVMFLDLDDFKSINDNLGHPVGNEVLKSFAKRLKSCLRNRDMIGRWGGDEFVILTVAIQSFQDIQNLAQRLIQCLQQPLLVANQTIDIRISIGIAIYPQDGRYAMVLINKADQALFQAKQLGKNQYRFFSSFDKF